jgi:hypothetical protein
MSAHGQVSVFGPVLRIELPCEFWESCGDAILRPVSPVVLGSAVVKDTGNIASGGAAIDGICLDDVPPPPNISFRAAALANMDFRPCLPGTGSSGGWDGYSFEWRIGAPHWLPKG